MDNQTLNTNTQNAGSFDVATYKVQNTLNTTPKDVSNIITPDDLMPQVKIDLPQTQPRPVTQPTNIVDGALNQLKLNESEQQAVNAEQNITARMLEDIAGLEGQSAFQNQLLEQSNIKQLRTDLQGLNSRILQKEAEIAQDDVKLIGQLRAEERRDTLLPFAQSAQARIQGDAQIVRALKMAEIGVLNAQAIGKQGDIQLARQFVDDAVNARYAPYKERIETGRMQLEALKPFLSRAEQKQAKSLDIKVNQAIKEIDRVSAFQTKILNNAIEAQASPSVIDAIMRGSSIQEIAKAGRGYEMSRADKMEQTLKQLQIDKARAELGTPAGNAKAALPAVQKELGLISRLLGNQVGLQTASGTTGLGRLLDLISPFQTKEQKRIEQEISQGKAILSPQERAELTQRTSRLANKQEFVGTVSQLLSSGTLKTLIDAKEQGATFGALSDTELGIIASSYSQLGAWAKRNKDGKITGFNASDESVQEELNRIAESSARLYESMGAVLVPNTAEGRQKAGDFLSEFEKTQNNSGLNLD